ncbi:three-Cys-motif partner protein TcmP [Anaeroselena agilis]|uniref:Three-Cys-motif partner protein TcmP n=1 Tax=Anaeroselena agilis TaxID=3063788 RepID=A0ABU3NTT1_9FIRM|nr:three-Cys-motif partner protein TcmP [Selenomonadales bacterium 4137-cl]
MAKDNSTFFIRKNSWSEIKDRLLSGYLPQYFQKLLMTNKPIVYVDCFAGKGKFDDGGDGSPRIALKIRDDCIGRTNSQNARIDGCFIDLNYADELTTNIADYCNCNGTPVVISGKYEEKIETLLSDKLGKNVFLYIDPYGIKALDYGLFSKFANYGFNSIEMLINMNSFGFFRDACRVMRVDYKNDEALYNLDDIVEYEPTEVDVSQQSEMLLNSIAGGDYWKAIVRDYKAGKIDGYQAEKRFSTEYKQRLRQMYTYVLDMPIRMKSGQRPKYRMIHVCNHEQGCILMADNMSSRFDELFIDIQNQGQLILFDYTPENVIIDRNDIQAKMLIFLSNFPNGMTADKLIAAFFTEYGVLCKSGTIREIWRDMEKRGAIEVTRIPPTTPSTGRPSNFFTEDKRKKQSVTIRRKP